MSLAELYRDHLNTVCERVERTLADAGFDGVAIHSGSPALRFLDDQPYPFTPNPHFRAWVPIAAPHSWVIHRPGIRPKLVFHQPADYWHSTPATPEEHWVDEIDLVIVTDVNAAREHIPAGRIACIGEPDHVPDWDFAAVNPAPVLTALHYDRAVKTPYELECMRRASAAAVRGHRAAAHAFRDGASEFGIHVEYLRGTGQMESALPYPNIIALNEHAAVLHYTVLETEAPVGADRRSFLIDAGAAFRGYACDITRSYAAHGGLYADLIAALEDVQQNLCSRVRAGVDYADIHFAAHRGIAGILRDAGLTALDADDAVTTGVSSIFFPHGIGHLIGLQVHDVAGLLIDRHGAEKARPEGHPYLRLTRTLEPGFVVTIEPGIYFIPMLFEQARRDGRARHINWTQIERLAPYGGVRIEDDVACTPDEPENLTRDAFGAAG